MSCSCNTLVVVSLFIFMHFLVPMHQTKTIRVNTCCPYFSSVLILVCVAQNCFCVFTQVLKIKYLSMFLTVSESEQLYIKLIAERVLIAASSCKAELKILCILNQLLIHFICYMAIRFHVESEIQKNMMMVRNKMRHQI